MKKFIIASVLALCFYAGTAMAAVNINTADADMLSSLPNIGEVKAAAIVKDREAKGDFETLDDLTRVKGIGSKTVEQLRDEATAGADNEMSEADDTSG